MLGRAITAVVFMVLLYLALEPLVRRRWPWRIVGWNRVLEGRFRDPLVGRDLLVGVLGGAGLLIVDQLRFLTPTWLGLAPGRPDQLGSLNLGANLPGMVCMWLGLVLPAMAILFALLILVTVCRREWLGNIAWVLLWPAVDVLGEEPSVIGVVFTIVYYALQLTLLLRAGFLAYTVALMTFTSLLSIPLTLDLSAWYAATGATYLLVLVSVAVYGFLISLGRGRLLGKDGLAHE
jgi:serine/threonine-protein kinase